MIGYVRTTCTSLIFFTMMSHELRTPITAIRAYVDILDDVDEIDDAARTMPSTPSDRTPKPLRSSSTIFSTQHASRPGAVKAEMDVVDANDIIERAGKDFGLLWRWTKVSR